jgi:hypothetical protein
MSKESISRLNIELKNDNENNILGSNGLRIGWTDPNKWNPY